MSTTTTPSMAPSESSTLSFRLQPDSRQVLTRKRARELLAPLSEAAYTSITLGGCALGDAAAGVAGPALVTLAGKKCVRSVTLADCIASLSQDEALRSLSALASSIGLWKGLVTVDLSYNALGSRGMAACAPLLHGQKMLEEVYLVECGLAAESARLLQGYLCAGPETKLRVLSVHGNRIESQGLAYLTAVVEKSPLLERLRLSSLGARAAAVGGVVKVLGGKERLKEVDLSDNLMDVEGARMLADVLGGLQSLERLILRDLDMGDEALAVILAQLAQTPAAVKEIAVGGNELGDGVVPALGVVLRACRENLRILDVGRNEIEDVGELVEALREIGEEGGGLTHLLMGGNEMGGVGVVRLAVELVKLESLQCFDVSGIAISRGVVEALEAALGGEVVVFDGLETVDGDGEEEEEESAELKEALQELAGVTSGVEKIGKEAEVVVEESGAASSSQSRSAVSRLVSMFSRGTDEGESVKAESVPSSQVVLVDESNPIDGQEEREGGESVEEDSGVEARRQAEGEDGGITATTVMTSETQAVDDEPSTPAGNVSAATTDALQSARKLKESIASLTKDIADVAGELQIPLSSPSVSRRSRVYGDEGDARSNVNEYLLVGDLPSRKGWGMSMLLDILGAILVAMFLVILVLAIAQSQEESTFTYRLV